MFKASELLNCCPFLDGQCKLVDALIYTIVAHNLRTVQSAVCGRECDFDVHLQAARIISCMRTIVYGCREIGNVHLLEAFGRQTCAGHCDVEHFSDGCAYRAFIFDTVAKHHVVGHDACLAVGRSCKVVEPRLACDGVRKFDGIPYGIDVVVGCL